MILALQILELAQPTFFIAPAIIAGGLALAGSAAQTWQTGRQNKKSRKFQEKMFHETNKYNAPKAQMARLAEAGLNPNLVYGGSSGGTAGTATQPAKPDFNTPEYGSIGQAAGDSVMNYYNAKSIQAGIDVNEQRADNLRQDTINKAIDSVNKTIQAHSGKLEYSKKARLFNTAIQLEQKRLEGLGIQNEYTAGKNNREERITQETIKKLRSQTRGQNYDNVVKKLEAELAKQGVRPNDPFYYSISRRILKALGLDFDNFKP